MTSVVSWIHVIGDLDQAALMLRNTPHGHLTEHEMGRVGRLQHENRYVTIVCERNIYIYI